jgi:hypothetical protein
MIQKLPQTFNILDPDGKRVIKGLERNNNIVLLVGSKISEWYPSNIPSGMAITSQIAYLLAAQLPGVDEKQRTKISDYIIRAPFEYLVDRCPRKDILRRILPGFFRIDIPNNAHRAIANLVFSGRIHSVITPNYDLCFDTLIPDGQPLKRVFQSI